MKRQIVYPGQIPLETDLLNTNKNVLTAIGHVITDMLGTSTLFSGLGCVPTGPAGMTVNVNPGRAYSLQSTDTGAYSSLAADATPLMKQGILLALQNFACPAPTTAGFSINYLIQAAFQEVDGGSTVLPYYNASNPAQAFSGPNGTGTPNTTYRDNTVQLQLKAGVAATTGTQTTPTVDSGFTGLWVITVAFGQVTITSTSIAQYAGAPILPASLLQMIQQGSSTYAVATGTANAHVAAFTPPLTARVDGMVLRYKAPAANTGALTFNDGLGAVAVVGAAHAALQGGETAANGDVWVQWNTSLSGGSYVLLDSTGGALQVAPATQSQHAMQLGQAVGRLLNIQTFTASGTYTPTSGTTKVRITCVGGGGSGGGAAVTTASQYAVGAGGGGGAYCVAITAIGNVSGATITVGAGGASASSSGNTGGTSSVGAFCGATGGFGGSVGLAVSTPVVSAGGAGGLTVSGTYSYWGLGSSGAPGIAFSTGNYISGTGGSCFISAGAPANTSAGAGNTANGYGAGGGGASSSGGSAAQASGSGHAGIVIIEEFA